MKPSSTTYATGSLSYSLSGYKVNWQTTGTLKLKQSTTSFFTPYISFYQASSSSDYPSTAIYGYGIDKGGASVSVKYSAGSSSPSNSGTSNYGFISTASWITCTQFAPNNWGTDGLDYFLLTMYKRTASSSITTTSTQYIWNTNFWYELHGEKYKTNISKLTRIKLAWGGDSSGDSEVYAWVSKSGSEWTVQLTNNLDIPVTFEYSTKKNDNADESFEADRGTTTITLSAKTQQNVTVQGADWFGRGNYAKVRVVSLGPSGDSPREVTYNVTVLGSGQSKPIIHRV